MLLYNKQCSRGVAVAIATLCTTASFALDYDVQRATTAPSIDGTVDSVWSQASPAMTNFVQHNSTGNAANQQTSVRLLWDDEKLYMLFEAQDSEIVAPMTANHTNFDFGTPQDTAEIFLDPALRQTTGNNNLMYHIAINPAENAYIYSEAGQNSTNWVPGPESAFAFSSSGTDWKIEMALAWSDINSTQPLSPGVLAGPPPSGTIWGAQFGRLHSPGTSNVVASKWEPTSGAFRTRPFGLLKFIGPPNQKPDLSGKTDLFSTSFETAEGYTAGSTPIGIDEWIASSEPERFVVTTDEAATGDQSVQMTVGSPARTLSQIRRTTNTETAQYLQYALYQPAETGPNYRHVLYIYGEYTGGNDRPGQIWFYGNPATGANRLVVYTYENATTTTAQQVDFVGIQAFDEWSYVTVKLDPVSETFEVWINDIALKYTDGSTQFPIKLGPQFQQFTYATLYGKPYGTDPVYIDDYAVVEDIQDAGISDWQLF